MDTIKPKVTPKDFFLWLAGMVTLYWSATALILLIHEYIEVLFPDVATSYYYYDPYSGTIRFAIASLVVVFPIYVYVMRLLHVDIRHDPLKKELWVRRWLVYLTLFVAGLTIAIDLIAVIYTFLEGDLTARFALKALTILVVLGGGFYYYLHELRGTWESKERESKLIGGFVALIVVATIVGGFFIVGSPFEARLLKIDERKVSDLTNIQYQLVNFWQYKQALPETLEELNDPLSGFVVPIDPETSAPYVYVRTSHSSFKLCATFNAESREYVSAPVMDASENWKHVAGEVCFDRTIDPERYPAFEKPIAQPRI